jgi:hypothetical protein
MLLGRDPAASQIAFRSFEEASTSVPATVRHRYSYSTFEFNCRLLLQ